MLVDASPLHKNRGCAAGSHGRDVAGQLGTCAYFRDVLGAAICARGFFDVLLGTSPGMLGCLFSSIDVCSWKQSCRGSL